MVISTYEFGGARIMFTRSQRAGINILRLRSVRWVPEPAIVPSL